MFPLPGLSSWLKFVVENLFLAYLKISFSKKYLSIHTTHFLNEFQMVRICIRSNLEHTIWFSAIWIVSNQNILARLQIGHYDPIPTHTETM